MIKLEKILNKYFSDLNNSDLFQDFHVHTNWTDGKNTIEENINKAIMNNLINIGFSDHIRKSSVYFKEYYKYIKGLKNEKISIYAGCEAKILNSNELDIRSDDFSLADYIIASVHSLNKNNKLINSSELEYEDAELTEFNMLINFQPSNKKIFIGHPFGMTIKHHKKLNLKLFEEFIINCKKNNITFEISSAYHKNYISDILILLKKYNPKVIFNSDSHNINHLSSWQKIGLKLNEIK